MSIGFLNHFGLFPAPENYTKVDKVPSFGGVLHGMLTSLALAGPMDGTQVRSTGMVTAQIAGILLALVLLMAAPPTEGRMLLVPMSQSAARTMVPLAVAQGARLIARGPLPASIVIYGQRAALASPLLKSGVLIVAAPSAGCGALRLGQFV